MQRLTKALMHRKLQSLVLSSTLMATAAGWYLWVSPIRISAQQSAPAPHSYLGFDLNTYPGDAALAILGKTFSFSGYWLNAPPGAKQNTWVGKRQSMLARNFGFLILY